MKRGRALAAAALVIMALGLASSGGVARASTGSVESVDTGHEALFWWADKPGGFATNWPTGLALLGLGMLGALVTVYLFNGELLPAMGGRTYLRSREAELKNAQQKRDESLTRRAALASVNTPAATAELQAQVDLTRDYDTQISALERVIARERARLLVVGVPLYVLLGGVFASALATTRVQALAVGFGWTATLEGRGLRRERDDVKQVTSDDLAAVRDAAATETAQLRRQMAVVTRDRDALRVAVHQLLPRVQEQGGEPEAAQPTTTD